MEHNLGIDARRVIQLPCNTLILALKKLTIFSFSSPLNELPTKKNLSYAFSPKTVGTCVKSSKSFSYGRPRTPPPMG